MDLHVYSESATYLEGTTHYLEFTPRAGRRCDPRPLCLLESSGGGTHPGYSLVTTGEDLSAIAKTLQDAEAIGLDIETTALSPRDGGCACSSSPPRGDVRHRRLRGQRPLTTHRGGRRRAGQGGAQPEVRLPVPARPVRDLTLPVFDTMLAAQVLAGGNYAASYSLEAVAERYLDDQLDKSEQRSDWSGS